MTWSSLLLLECFAIDVKQLISFTHICILQTPTLNYAIVDLKIVDCVHRAIFIATAGEMHKRFEKKGSGKEKNEMCMNG